ncbi:carbohydrate ABC transporter substrate-binding protein (CUT1 family) [Branchiibius hedensis]|uniref:Carbohydrate ABC transporter substrate-binding protein, CUT1 family n=1 Tax=Branchiibius hedensis TaxID=672460 RepID=A0A2Y8ZXQ2_9MICO|nr:extracellular solute-binding protein [Branchiibius hedensis]PWJ25844.1 carbohydrate ABC transporter substrate-binding protein (CUT1 family) [Branchiibius hedensis]SSA34657.1 carbohydrate ABC transporter substrate-binding protein, CUT1 family [Branchiibius hedensis]
MALSSKRTVAALAGLVAVSFGTVACGGSSDDGSGAGGGGTSVGASQIDKTDYSKWCDMKSQLQGKTVTVYTSIIGPEGAAQQASYKKFEECTGVTIKYQGDNDFEKNLPQRAQTGNLPDIAFIPQPGLLKTMVSTGKAIPAPQTVIDEIDKGWQPIWKTYGTVNGTVYAAPLGANVKSFVWYSPKFFKEKGYTVPTTWDEMMTLTKKIAADGGSTTKPWCGGISSGTATGWPATDWLEESMLRFNSPEDYDNWITNKLKFNDPKVLNALNKISDIFKNPAYVNGGHGDVKSIKSTTFQDAGLPILKDQCAMLQQASFYAANWPTGTKVGPDGDVWAFFEPGQAASDKPVEGGGEFTVAFRKAPEVQAFQAFLASADWANDKAKATPAGGWVSANKGLDINNLTSPLDQESYKLLQSATAFRFDASDLMPSSVGAGSFWTEMTNWIMGQSNEQTLDNIQKSWPSN